MDPNFYKEEEECSEATKHPLHGLGSQNVCPIRPVALQLDRAPLLSERAKTEKLSFLIGSMSKEQKSFIEQVFPGQNKVRWIDQEMAKEILVKSSTPDWFKHSEHSSDISKPCSSSDKSKAEDSNTLGDNTTRDNFEEIKGNHEDKVKSVNMKNVGPLRCRRVLIGSYAVRPLPEQPYLSVELQSDSLSFRAPMLLDPNKRVVITLQKEDIRQVVAHFGRQMPTVFVYTTPGFGERVRNTMQMVPGSFPYFDPSCKDDKRDKLTFTVECMSENQKNFIRQVFPGENKVKEIDLKTANEILIKSLPSRNQFFNRPKQSSSSDKSKEGNSDSNTLEDETETEHFKENKKIKDKNFKHKDKKTHDKMRKSRRKSKHGDKHAKGNPKDKIQVNSRDSNNMKSPSFKPPVEKVKNELFTHEYMALVESQNSNNMRSPPFGPIKEEPSTDDNMPLDWFRHREHPLDISKPSSSRDKSKEEDSNTLGDNTTTDNFKENKEIKGNHEDKVKSVNMKEHKNVGPLRCRRVLIGSYVVRPLPYQPYHPVELQLDSLSFRAPMMLDPNKQVEISLQNEDIRQVVVHFRKNLPNMFVYTTPGFGERVRNALQMVPSSFPYFEPSYKDDKRDKLTFMIASMSGQQMNFIRKVFPGENKVKEINLKTANAILFKSIPKWLSYPNRFFNRPKHSFSSDKSKEGYSDSNTLEDETETEHFKENKKDKKFKHKDKESKHEDKEHKDMDKIKSGGKKRHNINNKYKHKGKYGDKYKDKQAKKNTKDKIQVNSQDSNNMKSPSFKPVEKVKDEPLSDDNMPLVDSQDLNNMKSPPFKPVEKIKDEPLSDDNMPLTTKSIKREVEDTDNIPQKNKKIKAVKQKRKTTWKKYFPRPQ